MVGLSAQREPCELLAMREVSGRVELAVAESEEVEDEFKPWGRSSSGRSSSKNAISISHEILFQ